jgi:hypothetical protein
MIGIVAIILVIVLFFAFFPEDTGEKEEVKVQDELEVKMDLGNNLIINSIGSYSGRFYEDGSNDKVEDVLAIKVTNTGNQTLQYCEIVLSGSNETARFSLSTLGPKESVIVLESNKKTHTEHTYVNGVANHVVFFQEEPKLWEDILEIEGKNGSITITNISDQDIEGEFYLYYKNYTDGTYYGGITYRTKVSALKSGESINVISTHFSAKDSKILFIDMLGQ